MIARHAGRVLTCLVVAGCASTAASRTAMFSERSTPAAPRGTLLIVGGGSQPDELVKHFVDLAGGRGKARIAILPMATSEAAEAGAEKEAQLDSLGADSFVLNFPRSRADDDSLVRKVQTASGIWFPGGDQSLLTGALGGSAVLRAIHDRYNAGAVVGGTSAGAAVMSDSMITGNQFYPGSAAALDSSNFTRVGRHVIEIVPGLGFVHNAIVDQHFIRRQRANRLISVVLERPSLLGVGIDEGTALEVTPDGKWLVLGRSVVMILDARGSRTTSATAGVLGSTGVKLSLLPAGSAYDPRTGEALLPGSR
ncbi:MAG: cyanophycinase [Gemmatimonadaceae bacterium]